MKARESKVKSKKKVASKNLLEKGFSFHFVSRGGGN